MAKTKKRKVARKAAKSAKARPAKTTAARSQTRSEVPNEKEQTVLAALAKEKGPMHLSIMAKCFRDSRGNSWVRNSLRKLLRLGLVEYCGNGVYEATGVDGVKPQRKPQRKPKPKAAAPKKVVAPAVAPTDPATDAAPSASA